MLDYVLGIVKAYTTRVGTGPFPTELTDDIGAGLAKRGNEFGSVTGRPRRCGWLDLPALKRSLQLNGVDGLCITKLDVLDGMDEIRMCTSYREDGRVVDLIPTGAEAVAHARRSTRRCPAGRDRRSGRSRLPRCRRRRATTWTASRRSPACRSPWSRPARTATRRYSCTIRSIRPVNVGARRGTAAMSLKVTWDEYNALVERLALTVYESGFKFNQIICIARGGLRVGDVLSRIFEEPLAILSTHSYTAEGGTIRGELVIAEHMTMTKPRLGDRVLLVDDMVDSGHTLEAVHKELPTRFPHITALKTAVLWWKACSVFKPDYYVEYLPDNPWIHQPFEVYDDLAPELLKARFDR